MFPMDVDVKFRKDIFSNTSAQILESNLCSARILSGITAGPTGSDTYSVVSDNLSARGRGEFVKTRQPPVNKGINFYNLSDALIGKYHLESLVLTAHCLESSKGQRPAGTTETTVHPARSELESLAQETMRNYRQILTMPDISDPAQLTHSDAIGYRLAKHRLIRT